MPNRLVTCLLIYLLSTLFVNRQSFQYCSRLRTQSFHIRW